MSRLQNDKDQKELKESIEREKKVARRKQLVGKILFSVFFMRTMGFYYSDEI